jgi:hypothetical protein
MKRSKLIELLATLDTPGVDDPEVCFVHPEGFGNQSINVVKVSSVWRNGVEVPCVSLDFDANLEEEEPPKRLTEAERAEEWEARAARREDMVFRSNVRQLLGIAENATAPYAGDIIDPFSMNKIDAQLHSEFRDALIRRKVFLVKDGLSIVGGKARASDSVISILWDSDFYPRARFACYSKTAHIPLGFFEDYDLYLGLQSPLLPTLIAQYGARDGDYESFNPHYFPTIKPEDYPPQFAEAHNRAVMLGYTFKSEV